MIAADKHFFVCPSVFLSLYTFPACSCSVGASVDNGSQQDSLPQISAIAAYSKGFACSSSPGIVLLFEKTKGKELYEESQEIWVGRKKAFPGNNAAEACLEGRGTSKQLFMIIFSTPLNYILSIN